ncbi:MAG: PPC domain-containing protein [Phycisphaerales bacterium]|nr:PPC domain-containing protein [Phycisphaerales bacterium]
MKYTALCTIAAFAAVSHAGFFSEDESNNILDDANDIGVFSDPGGSIAIDGVLSDNDVDWFTFTLNQTASLSFFSAFGSDGADGIMQIVALGGDVIAFDDDSGLGLMPAIQIDNLAAGVYFIGLSGFGDVDSDSVDSDELANGEGHSQNFSYKLNVGFSIIPAPGATALLGMGGLVMTRRRRG